MTWITRPKMPRRSRDAAAWSHLHRVSAFLPLLSTDPQLVLARETPSDGGGLDRSHARHSTSTPGACDIISVKIPKLIRHQGTPKSRHSAMIGPHVPLRLWAVVLLALVCLESSPALCSSQDGYINVSRGVLLLLTLLLLPRRTAPRASPSREGSPRSPRVRTLSYTSSGASPPGQGMPPPRPRHVATLPAAPPRSQSCWRTRSACCPSWAPPSPRASRASTRRTPRPWPPAPRR